jgi:peptidoglycan hydrolase-like protein with peptidoglycan-binding domain
VAKRRRAVRGRSSKLVLALTVVGVLVGGAAAGAVLLRGDGPEAAEADETATSTTDAPTTTTSTTVAQTTTSTTVPPTTAPPTTAPPPAGLRSGDEGPEVLALQQRLTELGFWLGDADGRYAGLTQQAVMAFQKANDLGRDGVAGPLTLAALAIASRPVPQVVTDGIEISLDRQLLLVVQGGQTVLALNTSTGRSGWRTPRGDFTITREVDGLRHAPLGELWRPKYFNGGIAIHGSGSVPGEAASHGCARLSNGAIDMLWAVGLAPIGTRVVVY